MASLFLCPHPPAVDRGTKSTRIPCLRRTIKHYRHTALHTASSSYCVCLCTANFKSVPLNAKPCFCCSAIPTVALPSVKQLHNCLSKQCCLEMVLWDCGVCGGLGIWVAYVFDTFFIYAHHSGCVEELTQPFLYSPGRRLAVSAQTNSPRLLSQPINRCARLHLLPLRQASIGELYSVDSKGPCWTLSQHGVHVFFAWAEVFLNCPNKGFPVSGSGSFLRFLRSVQASQSHLWHTPNCHIEKYIILPS